MRCPACERHVNLEYVEPNDPFDCGSCQTTLRLEVDEGTYLGAKVDSLVIDEDGPTWKWTTVKKADR